MTTRDPETVQALANELREIAFMSLPEVTAALREIARCWDAGETHPTLRETPCRNVTTR